MYTSKFFNPYLRLSAHAIQVQGLSCIQVKYRNWFVDVSVAMMRQADVLAVGGDGGVVQFHDVKSKKKLHEIDTKTVRCVIDSMTNNTIDYEDSKKIIKMREEKLRHCCALL